MMRINLIVWLILAILIVALFALYNCVVRHAGQAAGTLFFALVFGLCLGFALRQRQL